MFHNLVKDVILTERVCILAYVSGDVVLDCQCKVDYT
jgi:hypothetical protein